MNLKIGTIIKDLRASRKITQDQLATFIGVTPQAISRWEAENGYPDIEILPAIADFFSITVDELLGLKRSERENRRNEIYKIMYQDDTVEPSEENDEILTRARLFAAEFPSDEKIQDHLAGIICKRYMWQDNPDIQKLQEAEKIYWVLLDTTKDNEFKSHLYENLAYLYAIGFKNKEKLDQVLAGIPRMAFCRESVSANAYNFLDGSIIREQDYIEKMTDGLCFGLVSYIITSIRNDPDMWDEKICMLEKLIEIYKFICGENLLFYNCRVAYIHRVIATYKIAQGKYDEALDELEKVLYYTKEQLTAKPDDKYTSYFMSELSYLEPIPGDPKFEDNRPHNDAWYILNTELVQNRYDPLREMARFKVIVSELETMAR